MTESRNEVRIRREPFAMIERRVLTDYTREELPPASIAVYVALMTFADNETGGAIPSMRVLADRAHMGATACRTALDHLIESGLVTREERRLEGTGEQTSNLYIVNVPSALAGVRNPEGGDRNPRTPLRNAKGDPLRNPKGPPPESGDELEPPELDPSLELDICSGSAGDNAKPTTKTTLPDGWTLDDDLLDWSLAAGLSDDEIVHEFTQFRDHAITNGRKQLDWRRSWQMWARNAVKFRHERASRAPRNHQTASRSGAGTAMFDGAEVPAGVTFYPASEGGPHEGNR